MAKCGRGAFLFRTDKQAIQCNRALTIVPNQTCGRCPRIASSKRCIVRPRPLTVNSIPPANAKSLVSVAPTPQTGKTRKVATDFATELSGTGWQFTGLAGTIKAKSADRSILPYPNPDSLGQPERSAKPFTPVQFRAWPPALKSTA